MILRELFKWLSFLVQLAIALLFLVSMLYLVVLGLIHLIKFSKKKFMVKRIHHVDDPSEADNPP